MNCNDIMRKLVDTTLDALLSDWERDWRWAFFAIGEHEPAEEFDDDEENSVTAR